MPAHAPGIPSAPDRPTIDAIADELYGLPPQEFTAARTRHEKVARDAGDRALARAIHSLAKPSISAWLVNQLVRERHDELTALLELGAGLREATQALAGEQLRSLSRERHALVDALGQQSRQIAHARGRTVSDATARSVEGTLLAALADAAAGRQLLGGRLIDALDPPGFGPADRSPIVTTRTTHRSAPAPAPRGPGVDKRRRAEQDVTIARQAHTDAVRLRDEAQAQVADTDRATDAAQRRVEVLRQELDDATTAVARAHQLRRQHASALQRTDRAARDAERRVTNAERRLERLTDAD